MGAVEPVDGGWRIADFAGYRPTGLRAADALSMIAEAIGRPLDHPELEDLDVEVEVGEPVPGAEVESTLPADGGERDDDILLTLGLQLQLEHPRPARRLVSRTGGRLIGVAAALLLVIGIALASRGPSSPATTAASDVSPVTTAPAVTTPPQDTPVTTAVPPAVDPEAAGPGTDPTPASTLPGSNDTPTGPAVAATCPSGAPTAAIDQADLVTAGDPAVTVRGTVTNAASAAISTVTIEVSGSLAGSPLAPVTTTVARTVEPGATVVWQAVLGAPAVTALGTPPAVTADVGGWDWSDPAFVACSG